MPQDELSFGGDSTAFIAFFPFSPFSPFVRFIASLHHFLHCLHSIYSIHSIHSIHPSIHPSIRSHIHSSLFHFIAFSFIANFISSPSSSQTVPISNSSLFSKLPPRRLRGTTWYLLVVSAGEKGMRELYFCSVSLSLKLCLNVQLD